mmetsp:Transcript_5340/g.8770  ORF Transcript_5340/g.8770 Transcript_5340/m.8770 type:complete len:88 (-) Transcript_5340:21-284(-)
MFGGSRQTWSLISPLPFLECEHARLALPLADSMSFHANPSLNQSKKFSHTELEASPAVISRISQQNEGASYCDKSYKSYVLNKSNLL